MSFVVHRSYIISHLQVYCSSTLDVDAVKPFRLQYAVPESAGFIMEMWHPSIHATTPGIPDLLLKYSIVLVASSIVGNRTYLMLKWLTIARATSPTILDTVLRPTANESETTEYPVP